MSRALDIILFLILAIVWGLSFLAIAIGLNHLPPLLFAAFRYDLAALILLGYTVIRLDDWLPQGRNNLTAIAGGGIFLVAGNGLLFIGQQTVPSGVAGILNALVPIATAVWAYFLVGERLSLLGAAGVATGFIGIGFVIQPNPTNLVAGDTLARVLILGQVTSISLGAVLIQWSRPTIKRVPLIGWSMLIGAIVLHFASLLIREPLTGPSVTPTALAAILYLGVFSTAIAFFIYFSILQKHGAFQAALVAYLVPIVATIVGVFVLNESISSLAVIGFVLVGVGFVMLKRDAIMDITGIATGIGRP